MILVITLGVTSVASEYGSRTVRTSFILTPRRLRVFAANAFFFFLMRRRPPRSTRLNTLFPYTTLFRSVCQHVRRPHGAGDDPPVHLPGRQGGRRRDAAVDRDHLLQRGGRDHGPPRR